jgi:hypothetical protein
MLLQERRQFIVVDCNRIRSIIHALSSLSLYHWPRPSKLWMRFIWTVEPSQECPSRWVILRRYSIPRSNDTAVLPVPVPLAYR